MQRNVRCLDPEELAWAAGFFDGEGSTIARTDGSRPRYHQLDVIVPQSGRDGVPDVLLRFQQAVLGLGTLDPPNDVHMHRWRNRGFEDAQATIALLWRFLSPVKRLQAASAMRAVAAQYASALYKARRPRSVISLDAHIHGSRCDLESHITRPELAWAAGFFDAEGWSGLVTTGKRPGLPPWGRVRASVSQHGTVASSPVVLERFAAAVGMGTIEGHGEADDYKWVVYGISKVERLRDTLAPWLGAEKLAQFELAISTFRSQPRIRGDRDRCVRGHVYSGKLERDGRVRHYCTACSRLRDRRSRAAKGIPPRQFKNIARRYNS